MKKKYEYYKVRVAVKVFDNGDEIYDREEWFHDPEPDYKGLKLHREDRPAVTVYDPDTGFVAYTQHYEMGELDATIGDLSFARHDKTPSPD